MFSIDKYPVLDSQFFARDTTEVARDMIGLAIVRQVDSDIAVVRIVETEAYHFSEPACHAFGQVNELGAPKRDKGRGVDLAAAPGTAYVYLSYGVHWLLNVTTEAHNVAAGVLIRAVEPIHNEKWLFSNRPNVKSRIQLTNGPGKLTSALQITGDFHRSRLDQPPLYFSMDRNRSSSEIETDRRVGISKATHLPWRFFLKGNPYVSR